MTTDEHGLTQINEEAKEIAEMIEVFAFAVSDVFGSGIFKNRARKCDN